ncbi:MAG: hypothetical protein COW13_04225 [Candidatus Omnitrophica bacterium CG12_big_fil_rev_8_21_14_0_65_50_5]|nr:MAG: hypothetical protein COW13_04225 [Candidatus Omnitrophica bacterium CG12_big_fil_rev_8_21_14_0_65_50_5]
MNYRKSRPEYFGRFLYFRRATHFSSGNFRFTSENPQIFLLKYSKHLFDFQKNIAMIQPH